MEIELKSLWQDNQVELLKQLHGYEVKGYDEEVGSVDYVAEDEEERSLLRVIVGPRFNASNVFTEMVRDTQEKLDEEEFDKAILMADGFSSASLRIVREDDRLEVMSPEEVHYSIPEVMGAIQTLTTKLCKSHCGGFPKTEEDCKGRVDGKYSCRVRMISDDTDFHARMRWLELLINDFSMLVDLRRERVN